MITVYQISANDSSANGLTNLAIVKVSMLIFTPIILAKLVFPEVSQNQISKLNIVLTFQQLNHLTDNQC